MKKVVKGKVYNTETAEQIFEWDNGKYANDFSYYEETLYRTKKGNWFIYGSGGALSKYSIECGNNSTCGSSDLSPVNEETVIAWLEKRNAIEELNKYFPASIEEG